MRYVPDQGKINHVFGLPYSFTSPELQAEMSFSYHIFFIACLFVKLWYHYPGWVRDFAPGYAVSGEENGDVYKKSNFLQQFMYHFFHITDSFNLEMKSILECIVFEHHSLKHVHVTWTVCNSVK